MPKGMARRLQELERRVNRVAPRKAPGLFYLDVDHGLYEKAMEIASEKASQPMDSETHLSSLRENGEAESDA